MNCKRCDVEFSGRFKTALYCTDSCKRQAYAERTGTAGLGLPRGTVGTISEMRIATDLLSKGFYTFRSLSPNSPCDFIAMKGNTTLRIEVVTGHKSKLRPGTLCKDNKSNSYTFDIMASISNDGSIIEYRPPLPI